MNGKSAVTVSGQSSIHNVSAASEDTRFATVQGGGTLQMTEASVLDIDHVANSDRMWNRVGVLAADGAGSTIANAGAIRAAGDLPVLMSADSGAQVRNTGTISASDTHASMNHSAALQVARGTGSAADNSGEIRMASSVTPHWDGGVSLHPLVWVGDAGYAQLAPLPRPTSVAPAWLRVPLTPGSATTPAPPTQARSA